MIKIQKSDCWFVPEGIYSGVLREARVQEKAVNGGSQKSIRLVFDLKSLKDPRYNMVVGRNYSFEDAAKFEADMVSWLGDEFYTLLDSEGVLVLSKLEDLAGHPAELHVTEIPNDTHKKPFSHLCGIKPLEKEAA